MSEFDIDGYELTYPPLGEGCTGEAFLATPHEDNTGNLFVIKHYRAMSVDRSELARNYRKFDQMPPISEIVRLVDYQMDVAPYYSIHDFEKGVTLDKRPLFKEHEAWHLISNLVTALGHSHKHGVIHGNLHPGNLILQEFVGEESEKCYSLKVTDFGAGLYGESHRVDLYDNAFFLAPEQLVTLGKDYSVVVAKKWDVYSFGVIAFWLLTDQFPRGEEYLVTRTNSALENGGNVEPVNSQELGCLLQTEESKTWSRRIGIGEREKLWLTIIDQCLELDPAKRPVDMREVQNRFVDIEHDFKLIHAKEEVDAALHDAEDRFLKERIRQRAKLISARTAVTILALSCLAASYLVVSFIKKTVVSRTQINELDKVVDFQKKFINQLDDRVTDTSSFLRQSRAAADNSFYKLTQQTDKRPSLSELEQARIYYNKVLDEVHGKSGYLLEKARALHSLAHIENLMVRKADAAMNFELAIEAFEDALLQQSLDESAEGTLERLADCYEYIGLLSDQSSAKAGYEATSHAIELFKEVLDRNPSDKDVALRLARICFRFGKYLYANNEYEEAIVAYTDSATRIESYRDKFDGDTSELDRVVANLQFHAAEALYEEERVNEAIDSYIAAIESAERLKSLDGFGNEEALLMARSFVALGDIFSSSDEFLTTEKDQVYNEALRLIVPIHQKAPNNVAIASFQCRILSRLAELERTGGNPKDGYQLSVRGIEALIGALESEPDNLFGFIQLAEARLNHLPFLMKDEKMARLIAARGVDTAKHAHNLVAANEEKEDYQYRGRLYGRLRQIFGEYGDICQKLGQETIAAECHDYASFKVSQN